MYMARGESSSQGLSRGDREAVMGDWAVGGSLGQLQGMSMVRFCNL